MATLDINDNIWLLRANSGPVSITFANASCLDVLEAVFSQYIPTTNLCTNQIIIVNNLLSIPGS